MQHDGLAVGGALVVLRQDTGDVLIRQAMKPITPHAALCDLGWQCEARRHRGLGVVERGVEAGDLWHLRVARLDRPERGEVMRLMEGGEWNERFQFRKHVRVDTDGR